MARTYYFGRFRLDAAARLLLRDNEPVSLAPKAFDCIAYLIEHRDRAVGRDELIAGVWGKVDVSDNVLGQVIVRARRVLGDVGSDHVMIRTVLRFGYQWIAPVEAEPRPVAPSTESSGDDWMPGAAVEQPKSPRLPVPRLVVIGTLIVLLAAVAWWHWTKTPSPSSKGSASLSALVLPVIVQSSDSTYGWVRLGAMDLIAERIRAAGIVVPTSDNAVALVHSFGGKDGDASQLQALAATARVSLVVQARAEAVGDLWRVAISTTYGRAPPVSAQGESIDVLDATRQAADAFARALGLAPAPDTENFSYGHAVAFALRRAEAARLGQELDNARSILQQLPAEDRERLVVRYQLAEIDLASGRLDVAQAAFEDVLEKTSAEADPILRARALHGLGGVSLLKHDYRAVERANEAAIATLAHTDAPRELGKAFQGRAIARAVTDRFDEALSDFARARVAFESAGDDRSVAIIDANVGTLNANRDHFAEALPDLQRTVDRLAAYGNLGTELRVLDGIAYCNVYLLEPAAGLANEARRNELQSKAAEPDLRYRQSVNWSKVLDANGRLAEARERLNEARNEAVEANDEVVVAWTHAIAAQRAWRDGDFAAAAQHAETMLKARQEDVSLRDTALARLTLIRTHLKRGVVSAADEQLQAMKTWAARSPLQAPQLYVSLAEAEIAVTAGSNDAVLAAYERALENADKNRVPFDTLQVAQSYAKWLIGNGDLSRASSIVGRVAGWAGRDYGAALLQVRLYRALGESAAWQHALATARNLAGERQVPEELLQLESR